MNAFTVGNPNRYETALDEHAALGQPLEKAAGGVVFLTFEAAAAVLEDGMLPRAWFHDDDEPRPGRVYRVELPDTVARCTQREGGLRVLTRPAKVSRCR